jgi:hypothetical protein
MQVRCIIGTAELSTKEKIHLLKKLLNQLTEHANRLENVKSSVEDKDRVSRLEFILKVRKQAMAYIQNSIDFLEQSGKGASIRQMPRSLAVPSWMQTIEPPTASAVQ